jgi:hypothetical protein
MSEHTLIQEQRAILRRLRQTTAHHTQLTTAADAQWQEVQRAYEEVRVRLAEVGEEQALRSATPCLLRYTSTKCPAQVIAGNKRD